jgi:hypothetical protein
MQEAYGSLLIILQFERRDPNPSSQFLAKRRRVFITPLGLILWMLQNTPRQCRVLTIKSVLLFEGDTSSVQVEFGLSELDLPEILCLHRPSKNLAWIRLRRRICLPPSLAPEVKKSWIRWIFPISSCDASASPVSAADHRPERWSSNAGAELATPRQQRVIRLRSADESYFERSSMG